MSYTALIWDDSCHLYTTTNKGTTWTESETQQLHGEWVDLQMAVNASDFTTAVASVMGDPGGSGNLYTSKLDVSTHAGATGSWSYIDPTNSSATRDISSFQLFSAGAISQHARTMVELPNPSSGGPLNYPRISTDTGSTWADITTLGNTRTWMRVCFDATATNMYIASNDSGTLFISRSSDGGTTWTDVAAPATGASATGYIVGSVGFKCSADGSVLVYASNWDNFAYISLNYGGTWVKITLPVPMGTDPMEFAAAGATYGNSAISNDGNTIVVTFGDSFSSTYPYKSYMAISKDRGDTWSYKLPPGILTPLTDKYVLVTSSVSPDGLAFIAGYEDDLSLATYGVDISIDGGNTFVASTITDTNVLGNNFRTAYIFGETPVLVGLTFAEVFDPSYLDFGTDCYVSFAIASWVMNPQNPITKLQSPYLLFYFNTAGVTNTVDMHVRWGFSANPNSGKFTAVQRLTTTDTDNWQYQGLRRKVRGSGRAFQVAFYSVCGQPFDITGWVVENSMNTQA